jgi:prepilin signal peptidase PulO-like enzyme (type II secretory pathway)
MIIIVALSGVLGGWLLNWVTDYLPRFSSHSQAVPVTLPSPPRLALWQLLSAQESRKQWFELQVGVEAITAVLFVYFWVSLGLSWSLVFWAGSYMFFMLVACIDLKYRLILNILTYPAILGVFFLHVLILKHDVTSILAGGLFAFSIFYLTARLRPGDLGGGDVKLATLIGVVFGFPQVLGALIVGAGTGGIVVIYLLVGLRRELKSTIPYGPFLCLGAMAALLYYPIPVLI